MYYLWICYGILILLSFFLTLARSPRRYDIYQDRVEILCSMGRRVISMEHIACVQHLNSMMCQAGASRYVSTFSTNEGIRIDLSVGCCSVLITPQNPQEFVNRFNAIKSGLFNPGVTPSTVQYVYAVPEGDNSPLLNYPQPGSLNSTVQQPVYYFPASNMTPMYLQPQQGPVQNV